jgi:hypothetical protein
MRNAHHMSMEYVEKNENLAKWDTKTLWPKIWQA